MADETPDDTLFSRTNWTVVRSAAAADSRLRLPALEALCEKYWAPLLIFARGRGHSIEDSEDLTQDFFCKLLKGMNLDRINPQYGSFRAYLLACFKHHLSNSRRSDHSQKRGGGFKFCSWEQLPEALAPISGEITPESFDRAWALTVIEQVRHELRAGSENFEEIVLLENFLPGGDSIPTPEGAARLGISESAFKVRVHRFRKRFSEGLRRIVAESVDSPEDLLAEMQTLLAALR